MAPGPIDVLVAALSSTDAVVVAEAANGLVARGALSALPSLVEIDVAARPWAAPSVIYALGKIAAKADAEDRATALPPYPYPSLEESLLLWSAHLEARKRREEALKEWEATGF